MLAEYVPILIFLAVAGGLGLLLLALGYVFAPRRPDPEKALGLRVRVRSLRGLAHEVRRALLPGRDPVHRLRPRDRIPVSLGGRARPIGLIGLAAMGVFLLVLVVGFIYEWKKGALEWD